MNRLFNRYMMALVLGLACASVAGKGVHYSAGSLIAQEVTVYDANAKPRQLLTLIQQQAKPVNVVFVFGGGGMGHARTEATGGLWCPDSFEDLHILRSLRAAYGDKIGIFPIAVPPAHHMTRFGFAEQVFLKPDVDSHEYQKAVNGFIESTQRVYESETIPVQPFYDIRYTLLASHKDLALRDTRALWHGAFRAADESQTYGVPSLWIVDQDGRVLQRPFSGNDYHGHGDKIEISYTLADVVAALESSLKNKPIQE